MSTWLAAVFASTAAALLVVGFIKPDLLVGSPTLSHLKEGNWLGISATLLGLYVVALPQVYATINRVADGKETNAREDLERYLYHRALVLCFVFVATLVASALIPIFLPSNIGWVMSVFGFLCVFVHVLGIIDLVRTMFGLRKDF